MIPSGGEWIKQWSTPLKQDLSIPSYHTVDQSQSEMLIVRSCYLWPLMELPACWYDHEWESDRALCPGMTQTQTYALDTEPACLKERGQSAGWVQGTREPVEAQEIQHDRHSSWRCMDRDVRTHIYGYFNKINNARRSLSNLTWNLIKTFPCLAVDDPRIQCFCSSDLYC